MGLHEQWWTKLRLGMALQDLKRYDEAIRVLEEAVHLRPDKPEGWRQLALSCSLAGNPAKAAANQLTSLDLLEREYKAAQIEPLEYLIGFQLDAGR